MSAKKCSVGCGRLAAHGYETCCITCTRTTGGRHGPRCDKRTTERISEVFKSYDLNGNGEIEPAELNEVLSKLAPDDWSEEKVMELFAAMDTKNDGVVDVEELLAWLFDKPEHELFMIEAEGKGDHAEEGLPADEKPDEADAGMTSEEKLERDLKKTLEMKPFLREVECFYDNGGKPRRLGEIADKEELLITEKAAFHGTGQMAKIAEMISTDSVPPSIQSLFRAIGLRRLALAQDVNGRKKPTALRYALLCAKLLGLTESQGFDDAAMLYTELLELPWYWDVNGMVASEGYSMIFKAPATPEVEAALQILFNETFDPRWTHDRTGDIPTRMVVTGATEVQNAENWAAYCSFKRSLADYPEEMWCPDDINTMKSSALDVLPELDPTVSEAWLYHGCSGYAAGCITSGDFRISLAGTTRGTLFGNGVYTAESCAKSDEYAQIFQAENGGCRYILVCRVCLGNMFVAKSATGDKARRDCIENNCHSTLGERRYREFIVYDERQIYPEYVVQYTA